MLQNGKCTDVLWLRQQTSKISLTTFACCGELVIPPTLKSDSLAQDSPLSLDAHVRQAEVIEWFLFLNYSNKYTQNQSTMHVPIEWRSFLYKNKKQNKKKFTSKQGNVFVFLITECFRFLLDVLTARPKIWYIEGNVI